MFVIACFTPIDYAIEMRNAYTDYHESEWSFVESVHRGIYTSFTDSVYRARMWKNRTTAEKALNKLHCGFSVCETLIQHGYKVIDTSQMNYFIQNKSFS